MTCMRPDILYGIGFINRFMENSRSSHFLATEMILPYIKDTSEFAFFILVITFFILLYTSITTRQGILMTRSVQLDIHFLCTTLHSFGHRRSNLLFLFLFVKLNSNCIPMYLSCILVKKFN